MTYPMDLINQLRERKTNRETFCRQYAALQGFDNTAKGYSNRHGTFIEYRGRNAKVVNGRLVWYEHNQRFTAATVKEMKIRIDIEEIKAGA